MPYASHRRASTPLPHYGLPHAAQRQSAHSCSSSGMAHAFRRARTGCASPPRPCASSAASRTQTPRQSNVIWSAAFALLVVANLSSPTRSAVPKRIIFRDDDVASTQRTSEVGNGAHLHHLPMAHVGADGVAIKPVTSERIKSTYSLAEFLEAIATSSHPFRNAGDSLRQMYAIITGEAVHSDTRKSIDQWTDAFDMATGMIPDVGLTRIPGEIAEIASDGLEGRVPKTEQIGGFVQSADPRNYGSRGIVRAEPDLSHLRRNPASARRSRRRSDSKRVRGCQPDAPDSIQSRRPARHER